MLSKLFIPVLLLISMSSVQSAVASIPRQCYSFVGDYIRDLEFLSKDQVTLYKKHGIRHVRISPLANRAFTDYYLNEEGRLDSLLESYVSDHDTINDLSVYYRYDSAGRIIYRKKVLLSTVFTIDSLEYDESGRIVHFSSVEYIRKRRRTITDTRFYMSFYRSDSLNYWLKEKRRTYLISPDNEVLKVCSEKVCIDSVSVEVLSQDTLLKNYWKYDKDRSDYVLGREELYVKSKKIKESNYDLDTKNACSLWSYTYSDEGILLKRVNETIGLTVLIETDKRGLPLRADVFDDKNVLDELYEYEYW